jgi:membrane fusion protein (multidrug efflux system)
MKFHKSFIGGLILFVLCSSCKQKQSEQQEASKEKLYPTQILELQEVELQSVFPAVLKGQEDIDIKPRVEGFIEAVYVDEGTKVKTGQPLFKINSPSSIKALEEAQANYNTAKLDVERMRPLAEEGIISKVVLESYENSYSSAKAALEQAKATMTWVTVTSPVDGVVGTLTYRLGSLVSSSSVLTTVANTTNVVAYFSMNETELYAFMRDWEGATKAEKIRNMPDVRFLLSDGTEYEEPGRIETISGIIDQTSGTVNVRAVFPNKNGQLLSGTSGKVIIPKYLNNALVIPQKATFSQQDKILVYKLMADSVVQKAILVKSTPDGNSYAVIKGLDPGDKIVTDGIATLRNGQRIKEQ